MAILFLGGWLPPLDVAPLQLGPGAVHLVPAQDLLLVLHVRVVKAIVPRYRYDQLMRLGWKVFLPISLVWVVLDRRASSCCDRLTL